MAIRIVNVCGRVLDSETRSGTVKIFPGKPLELEGYMDIGPLMKQQIDLKLVKVAKVDPVPIPGPKSIDPEAMKKEAAKKAKLRAKAAKAEGEDAEEKKPAPPKKEAPKPKPVKKPVKKADPYAGLKGDKLISAVMQDMIDNKDNLGSDGKPNQPVLEAKVQEVNPRAKVTARKRDKIFKKLAKE